MTNLDEIIFFIESVKTVANRLSNMQPIPKSILAGPLNMTPGMLYSLLKLILYGPDLKMDDNASLSCFNSLHHLWENNDPGHCERLIASEGELQKGWLANFYFNCAISRFAIIFEKILNSIVFSYFIDKKINGLFNPYNNTINKIKNKYVTKLVKVMDNNNDIKGIMKSVNENLKFNREELIKLYNDLSGKNRGSQFDNARNIINEHNRLKHHIFRQFSSEDDPGLKRKVNLPDLINASHVLLGYDGLIIELFGIIFYWSDSILLNFRTLKEKNPA